ncbi:hypothetical protein BgiBS90_005904 [Biomphalaria glabrata]|nr:hypothetical protein BgiBS90_005904 [Biomphalaria glabrata]
MLTKLIICFQTEVASSFAIPIVLTSDRVLVMTRFSILLGYGGRGRCRANKIKVVPAELSNSAKRWVSSFSDIHISDILMATEGWG